MGSYELYFEGNYPLLQASLKEEIVSRITRKRAHLSDINLRLNDDRKLGKIALNVIEKNERSQTDQITVSAQDGFSLERVRVVPARILVTNTHLM